MAFDRQDDRFLYQVLLDNAVATTDGSWVSLAGRHPVTVSIEGTFVGSVQVLVSNNPRQPLDSFNDVPVFGGLTHTAPAAMTVDAAYQWIKVRVSAYTSGSISAFMLGGPGPW
jgi:hypothetical protein